MAFLKYTIGTNTRNVVRFRYVCKTLNNEICMSAENATYLVILNKFSVILYFMFSGMCSFLLRPIFARPLSTASNDYHCLIVALT